MLTHTEKAVVAYQESQAQAPGSISLTGRNILELEARVRSLEDALREKDARIALLNAEAVLRQEDIDLLIENLLKLKIQEEECRQRNLDAETFLLLSSILMRTKRRSVP